jgi:hypothetical protein
MYVPKPAEKDLLDRLERTEKRIEKTNRQATIAFAVAVIFMGLQFWPATYTDGMKKSLSAIFFSLGLWIFLKTSPERTYTKVLDCSLKIIIGAAILTYIILWARGT